MRRYRYVNGPAYLLAMTFVLLALLAFVATMLVMAAQASAAPTAQDTTGSLSVAAHGDGEQLVVRVAHDGERAATLDVTAVEGRYAGAGTYEVAPGDAVTLPWPDDPAVVEFAVETRGASATATVTFERVTCGDHELVVVGDVVHEASVDGHEFDGALEVATPTLDCEVDERTAERDGDSSTGDGRERRTPGRERDDAHERAHGTMNDTDRAVDTVYETARDGGRERYNESRDLALAGYEGARDRLWSGYEAARSAALDAYEDRPDPDATVDHARRDAERVANDTAADAERVRGDAEAVAGQVRGDAEGAADRVASDARNDTGRVVDDARNATDGDGSGTPTVPTPPEPPATPAPPTTPEVPGTPTPPTTPEPPATPAPPGTPAAPDAASADADADADASRDGTSVAANASAGGEASVGDHGAGASREVTATSGGDGHAPLDGLRP